MYFEIIYYSYSLTLALFISQVLVLTYWDGKGEERSSASVVSNFYIRFSETIEEVRTKTASMSRT
jgi:hypothetical protein